MKLVYSEEQAASDGLEELTPTAKTTKVMCEIFNSVEEDISITTESEEEFPTRRLPTLDCELWIERVESEPPKIKYSFFKKPLSSKFVVMEKSALSWDSKRAVLSQEVIRRSMNMCNDISQEERDSKIENFTTMLLDSGYTHTQAREVVVSGLTGYERKVEKAASEGSEIHRGAKEFANHRRVKKLTGKQNWFKNKAKEKDPSSSRSGNPQGGRRHRKDSHPDKSQVSPSTQPSSMFFCPRTPGGILASRLREVERNISTVVTQKVKIVE